MRVGFCFNLKKETGASDPGDLYAEWDDEETIEAVRSALAAKHEVIPIEADEDAFEKFRKARPAIVFNMAEGIHGNSREAQIPSILEMLGIPYTGSDPLTLAVCLDKAMAKVILRHHGIPTPGFRVVAEEGKKMGGFPPFPLIVKPLREGSSKGILNSSLVRNARQLKDEIHRVVAEYRQPALVEAFLPGREFTVAMLGNGRDVEALPIVEIQFGELPREINPIYSFEAKWIWDTVEKPLEIFSCPAKVPAALRRKIESVCRGA
ncbi:MAG TPA: D-alanine--D-alanine ligase, partial [Thermodesulfobacteriota bacterium]|nr:D-alanine--D-alanine ligase [Thermodesulfobacteriota bacterium]